MTSSFELHNVKGGKLEKVRYILHEFDDGTKVKFKIETDRSVHELDTSNQKVRIISRVYKSKFCPHSIDTRELDYQMLDQWVADNCCGLWYRGGFATYNFQQEDDAIYFKLTWGDVGGD